MIKRWASIYVALAVLFVSVALSACTDESAARRALDNYGFKQVEITGYRPWACGGESYTFHTGFRAVNVNGKQVTGAVCSGWLVMSTVKFD